MKINSISVSSKRCFDTCQQQYKYKYHLEIKPDIEEKDFFTYGSIVHRVAELYVKYKETIPIGKIATQILRGEIAFQEPDKKCPWRTIPEKYKSKFITHLTTIKNLTKKYGTDGFTEYRFHYDLDPPNEKYILGFIDRLILKDNKAILLDYKTTKPGKWRVNQSTAKNDIQLMVYSMVVQQQFNIPAENIEAKLVYLESANRNPCGDIVSATFDDETLQGTRKLLLDTYNTILNMPPEKAKAVVGRHCFLCDYKNICPYYNTSNSTN